MNSSKCSITSQPMLWPSLTPKKTSPSAVDGTGPPKLLQHKNSPGLCPESPWKDVCLATEVSSWWVFVGVNLEYHRDYTYTSNHGCQSQLFRVTLSELTWLSLSLAINLDQLSLSLSLTSPLRFIFFTRIHLFARDSPTGFTHNPESPSQATQLNPMNDCPNVFLVCKWMSSMCVSLRIRHDQWLRGACLKYLKNLDNALTPT